MAKIHVHKIETSSGVHSFACTKRDLEYRLLPYGIYRCHDGALVLYDRWYRPMFRRAPDGTVQADDLRRYVRDIKDQCWFYHDGNCPRYSKAMRARCTEIRDRWAAAVGGVLHDTGWDENETQDSAKWYARRPSSNTTEKAE